jgi:hypothetical protein
MFRLKLRAAIAALTALAALVLAASALATEPLQWSRDLLYSSNQPNGTFAYTLANDFKLGSMDLPHGGHFTTNQDLVFGNETFGVDLTWFTPDPLHDGSSEAFPNPGRQWQFVRRPGLHFTTLIPAAEHVALYNTARHGYLAEGHETFGIGLIWSATPRYEWQVAQGEPNQTPGSYRTELYNDTERAYLIEHSRTWGVDLTWLHAPFSIPFGYQAPASNLPVSQLGGNHSASLAR